MVCCCAKPIDERRSSNSVDMLFFIVTVNEFWLRVVLQSVDFVTLVILVEIQGLSGARLC